MTAVESDRRRPNRSDDFSVVDTGATPSVGVEALLAQRAAILRRFVDELERDAERRLLVSAQHDAARAEEACRVQSELWLLPESPTGAGPRRLALEARLAALAEGERAETVACWWDVAALGRERRAWLKEGLELQARLALLPPSMPSGEAYR